VEQALERCVYLERLGLFGCVQCGKCTAGCPINYVTPSREPFNIRTLVYDVLNAPGEAIASEKHFIWQCTTCGTCSLRCPKEIEPKDVVINLRSILVEDGTLPPAIRDVLKSISVNYNPWSLGKEKRAEWFKDLELKNAAEAQTCLYIGCTPAFDPRLHRVARAHVACRRPKSTSASSALRRSAAAMRSSGWAMCGALMPCARPTPSSLTPLRACSRSSPFPPTALTPSRTSIRD
jgi:heterodisulfide reductase subunit C